MSAQRDKKFEKSLDVLYETWKLVRSETIARLGKEDAVHIINFHGNNWIDITNWILSKYNREEQMNIVFIQFIRLFKEIYWLQFIFHNANYPMVYRNLRYVLEMIAQAYYVDCKYPILSLDEQIGKIMGMEKRIYGRKLVKAVLCPILNLDEKGFKEKFQPIWDYLNKHVHPSAKQMDIVVEEDFSSLVTDSFNENLARETLEVVDEIFDLIYVMVLEKFSRVKELVLEYKFINEWEKYLPNTVNITKATL
ncbi:MAG: hypothetical protein IIB56_00390 [Planctomycetes bacterium]|nr:hypothetical protein [Planctomycetota bacterium]